MKMANGTYSEANISAILERSNVEYAGKMLPVITFVSVVMCLGACGNILVFSVYSCARRKSVTNLFVATLAVLDLINCLLSIPSEIMHLRFKYTLGDYIFWCKGTRVLAAFTTIAPCGLLIVIAIDRYKQICQPFKHQTTLPLARSAIGICCLLTICIAIPAWFLNGKRTVVVNAIRRSECTISDEHKDGLFPICYNSVLFSLYLGGCAVLIVFYTLIWKRLQIQQKFRRALGRSFKRIRYSKAKTVHTAKEAPPIEVTESSSSMSQPSPTMETLLPVSSSVSSSSITPTMETLLPVSSSVSSSSITPTMETLLPVSSSVSSSSITSTNSKHEQRLEHNDLKTVPKPKTPVKTKAGAPVVTKTTLVMFLIAVVFVFSFLPYLIIATLKYVNRQAWRQVGDVKSVVYQFFLKFHYVNSACNPIVYSFCGRRFRKDFRQFRRDMAYKLQCWIKQRDRR